MQHDKLFGFDPNQVAPSTGQSRNLPPSDPKIGHQVVISDARWKAIKDNAETYGELLELTFSITEGPHAGKSGTENLNLNHKTSAETVAIARAQLSAICHCCGHLTALNGINDLFNKPFRAVVEPGTSEEAKAKGWTNIARYQDINGNAAGSMGGGAAPAAVAPTAPAPAPAAPVAAAPAAPAAAPAAPAAAPAAAPVAAAPAPQVAAVPAPVGAVPPAAPAVPPPAPPAQTPLAGQQPVNANVLPASETQPVPNWQKDTPQ